MRTIRLLRLISLPVFLLWSAHSYSQENVTSVSDGDWMADETWSCTECPPTTSSGTITIAHTVTLSDTVQADQIVIAPGGALVIQDKGRLIITEGNGADLTQQPGTGGALDGRVTIESGGILENRGNEIASIPSAMIFQNGSEYQHNLNGGKIPFATWESGSTCRITGWTTLAGSNSDFQSTLVQDFYHFIWDSPSQSAAIVFLAGKLSMVRGDLVVNNTNAGTTFLSLGSGSGEFSGSISILGDFVVNGASRIYLTNSGTLDMQVGGNVELSSTASINHYIFTSSGTVNLDIGGNLTLDRGELNLAQNAGGKCNITLKGDLVLNGGLVNKPLVADDANIFFAGSLPQSLTIGGGSFTNLQPIHFTVVSGSTLNIMDPVNLEGNLIVEDDATINLGADIFFGGNVLIDEQGTFNSNSRTITLDGILNQTFSVPNQTLDNLIIDNSLENGQVELTAPLALTGRLSIISESTTFISNGNLRLISTSDSDSDNASIGPLLNQTSIQGAVTVERYMSDEGRLYRYISSPVQGMSVAALQESFPITGKFTGSSTCIGCTTNPSFFYYDTDEYVEFPESSVTEVLEPGRGYSAFIRQNQLPNPGPLTIPFFGPVNQGVVDLSVSFDPEAAENFNWNLVGNPYPSSIDWDSPDGWLKVGMSNSIAIPDNGEGNFLYWNGEVGDFDGKIATGQAFWIQSTAESPTLTINEAAKTDTTASFYRQRPLDLMVIKVSKGSLTDKTYFQIHPDAQVGFDRYDASKLQNAKMGVSTRFDNTSRLAINAVDHPSCDKELLIDLQFTKDQSGAFVVNPQGNYQLYFDIQGTEFSAYKIMLADNFTNKQIDVSNDVIYTFSITDDPASMAPTRFKLTFQYTYDPEISVVGPNMLSSNFDTGNKWFLNGLQIKGGNDKVLNAPASGIYTLEVTVGGCTVSTAMEFAVTGIEDELDEIMKVYPNPSDGQLLVKTPLEVDQISLVNSMGQVVNVFNGRNQETQGEWRLDITNLRPGVYFLKSAFHHKPLIVKVIRK